MAREGRSRNLVNNVLLPSRLPDQKLAEFASSLGAANESDAIVVDFQSLSFIEPGCVVSLLAKTHRWLSEGRSVYFRNHERCGALKYLQRMNFFAHCGVPLEERFCRWNPSGRFVEIQRLGVGKSVEDISTSLATCIAPELADTTDPEVSGLFDCVEYSLSELALNVSQHSQSQGFVMAQFYERRDLVCLAIADHGIGIKESFLRTGSQHVSQGMSDLDSIRKALESRVSSKGHLATAWGDPINAGVGLTLLHALATEVGGKITIVSGAGAYSSGRGQVFPEECRFQGTICAMSFPRSRVTNFGQLLNDAKTRTGLLKSRDGFSELFQ